ncbi:MAG TPA: biotin/lipoyl-binding protein [Ohtaekwangia sp.]|nr:biotin/lipoyl-binding protein [Ohtaekwangia sp.]
MKLNWFYIFVALLFSAMLFLSVRYFKGSGHGSVGIAYAKERNINSEKSAIVKSIPVIAGQEVKAGDLLVQLTSNELEIEIHRLENKLVILRSEQAEKRKVAASKIDLIRSENSIRTQELSTEISESEGELELNRQLITSFKLDKDSVVTHPAEMKINALKEQRRRHEETALIRIEDVRNDNQMDLRNLENEIKLLEKELELFEQEKIKLSKYATTAGVISNVFVKEGEQIQSYTSLLSVNPLHPTTVVGYLVGRKVMLPVGSTVQVASYERSSNQATGKVIGYGSVVELPLILQKSTATMAFGREVFIQIPDANPFASGEKVIIR